MDYQNDYSIVEVEIKSEEEARFVFEQGAKLSPYQKVLDKRLYRKVDGFISPKAIFKNIAFFLYSLDTTILTVCEGEKLTIDEAVDEYLMSDPTTVNSLLIVREWFDTKSPVFCLDKELAKAFLNTSKPQNLPDIKPFARCGMLMLPQGLIKNPDGEDVNYLIFLFLEEGESLIKNFLGTTIGIPGTRENPNMLSATFHSGNFNYFVETVAQNKEKYVCGSSIGQIQLGQGLPKDEETLTSELEFTEQIRSLLIQTFLYQQTYHADDRYLIKDSDRKSPRQKQSNSNKPLTPIVIGADYKIKRISLKKEGTHASPSSHWRRGHWRNQPFGNRENPEYKAIWLEPMFING